MPNISSLRNIFLKTVVINLYSVSRRYSWLPQTVVVALFSLGVKVIVECQKHDNYQESVTWLLDFIKEYAKHGPTITKAGKEHAEGFAKDVNLKRATLEIRTLLERFANGMSLDIIIGAVDGLTESARSDDALREWFSAVDTYLRRVLLEPGYVLEPVCNTQANHLRETGRQFYDEKYRDRFNNLFDSIGTWFKAFGDDPVCC